MEAKNAKNEVSRLNALMAGGSSASYATAAVSRIAEQERKLREPGRATKIEPSEDEGSRQIRQLQALGVVPPEPYYVATIAEERNVTSTTVKGSDTGLWNMLEEKNHSEKKRGDEAKEKRKCKHTDDDEQDFERFHITTRKWPVAEGEISIDALFRPREVLQERVKVKRPEGLEMAAPRNLKCRIMRENSDSDVSGMRSKLQDIQKEGENMALRENECIGGAQQDGRTTTPTAKAILGNTKLHKNKDTEVFFKPRRAMNIRKK